MDMITEGGHIAASAASLAPGLARPGEYLTFRLGEEEYGAEIRAIQEIRSWEQPTRIPNTAEFIKGVINLRGVIVPVIDLRMKLACAEAAYSEFTVVIILTVQGRVVGAVVDAVCEVLELAAADIKERPGISGGAADFIIGIAGTGERMLMLVDMDTLLAGDMTVAGAAGPAGPAALATWEEAAS